MKIVKKGRAEGKTYGIINEAKRTGGEIIVPTAVQAHWLEGELRNRGIRNVSVRKFRDFVENGCATHRFRHGEKIYFDDFDSAIELLLIPYLKIVGTIAMARGLDDVLEMLRSNSDITVGDEVEEIAFGLTSPFVVTGLNRNEEGVILSAIGITASGGIVEPINIDDLAKTGRHFPIAEILLEMRK